jgi:tRNA-Thr(GGU) m(6)t(6)A37 methyltransferase TsaA
MIMRTAWISIIYLKCREKNLRRVIEVEKVIDLALKPIGFVRASVCELQEMPAGGLTSQIVVFPPYVPGLLRIEENSHLWILSWFHKGQRNLLTAVSRVNPGLPAYGVFSLRTYSRPNPIALTLVKLEQVDGNVLHVKGLDAVDGTPVLDIKPYHERDMIFSPVTPYIRPADRDMRLALFMKEARNHHQEECPGMLAAVRMALVADEIMGQLNTPDLQVEVCGPACLADTLQGITHARLANPPRFKYHPDDNPGSSRW